MEEQSLQNNDDNAKHSRWGFKVWFPILWLVLALILMVVLIVLTITQTPAA